MRSADSSPSPRVPCETAQCPRSIRLLRRGFLLRARLKPPRRVRLSRLRTFYALNAERLCVHFAILPRFRVPKRPLPFVADGRDNRALFGSGQDLFRPAVHAKAGIQRIGDTLDRARYAQLARPAGRGLDARDNSPLRHKLRPARSPLAAVDGRLGAPLGAQAADGLICTLVHAKDIPRQAAV